MATKRKASADSLDESPSTKMSRASRDSLPFEAVHISFRDVTPDDVVSDAPYIQTIRADIVGCHGGHYDHNQPKTTIGHIKVQLIKRRAMFDSGAILAHVSNSDCKLICSFYW